MVEEEPPEVGDGAVGGFAAGSQEEAHERLDVMNGEALPLDLSLAELGDEVIAGVAKALLDKGFEIVVELLVRLDALLAEDGVGG